jgi:hypothetical protein
MKQKLLPYLLGSTLLWALPVGAQQAQPSVDEDTIRRAAQNISYEQTNERGLYLEPNTETRNMPHARSIYPESPLGRTLPPTVFYGGIPKVTGKGG